MATTSPKKYENSVENVSESERIFHLIHWLKKGAVELAESNLYTVGMLTD